MITSISTVEKTSPLHFQTLPRCIQWLCMAAIGAALLTPCLAATDHIREFAKNKPRVIIVVSGPEADGAAHLLQNAIMHHGDNKHAIDDLPILTINDAESSLEKDAGFGNCPVVFLLCGNEMGNPLPAHLASILPFEVTNTAQKTSVITSALSAQKDGQFFRVGLFAPDSERLRKLYDIFAGRQAENFRALPFNETYITNKLALFSTAEDQADAEQWGKLTDPHAWNDIQWFSLADRAHVTREQLAGRTRVYFLNRADHAAAPAEASAILNGRSLKPTTILIAKESAHDTDDGGVVVFSAPNSTILWGKALHRFPNAGAVPVEPFVQEAVDMRTVTRSALLMSGSMPDGERGDVRQMLAAELQKTLGIEIGGFLGRDDLERAVSLEQLQDGSDIVDRLRRKPGSRYVLQFAVTDYRGRTEYEPLLTKVTHDAPAFAQVEPTQPSESKGLFQGKKPKDQYDREMADYRTAHAAWQAKKNDYDRDLANAIYRWARRINTHEFAHAHGVLHLVDISDPSGGKVVWERECDGSQESLAMYRHDVVQVRGQNNRPPGLELPPASSDCAPELLHKAVQAATADALLDLQESVLIPQGGASTTYGVSETTQTPPPPSEADSPPAAGYVADIQDGIVTLNIGSAQGVRVGDRIVIPTKTKEITDPITGKVIDMRALDSIILRVTVSGATADCKPVSVKDAAKLKLVHRGMAIQWEHANTQGQ